MIPVDERYSVGSHWLALKSSRKWILASTLIAAVGAGLFSSVQTRIFGAKTQLLVLESKIGTPDLRVPNEVLRSYETFLLDDSLIQNTINNFGLQRPPYRLSVEAFRRGRVLRISLQKDTRILEIAVEFPQAQLAADIANFFAKQAIGLNEEMSVRDRQKVVLFFQKEMERASENLEVSNKRLAEFIQTSRIEETRLLAQRLSQRMAEDEARLFYLRVEQATSVAKRKGQNPENNGEELNLSAEIGALQEILRVEARKLSQLMQEKVAREGTLNQLTAENKLAGDNYAMLGRRVQEASLMVSARAVDLRQVSPALTPERPIRPRTPLNILLGAIFGFLASTLLTLLIQNFSSPRKRTEERHDEEKLREIRRGSTGY
jgi:tyrosine-protein kinase Etk/Wzc